MEKQELTFAELASLWWQQYALQKMSGSTRISRAGFLERELDPEFGNLPCSAITHEHVTQWDIELKQRQTGGLAQRLLKQIFRWGHMREHVETNPTLFLQVESNRSNWTYLTFEERRVFLESEKDSPDYPMWLFAFFMGLRVGEISALDKCKIDLHRKVIDVDQHYCKDQRLILPGTKGSKPGKLKHRTLPIPDILLPYCVQILNQPHNHCFSNSLGRRMVYDTFNNRFKQALEKAGVREVRVHDIRHTFGSHYVMRGGSIYHLRDWMGHTSIKQTERYAHLNPEVLRQSANLVVEPGFEVLQVAESA